jgi:hypothetical protein
MRRDDKERQDPLAGVGSGEPAEDLGLTSTSAVLTRRPSRGGRRTPLRPSEKRRKARRVGVTFSTEEIPERLRALARRWGLCAPDGQSPNVSALVEYLLLAQLEAAEAGEIGPPEEAN